ncbi:MAG: nucleotidyltransferase domain-containing protein [Thermoanaerobaculia bacterium]
MRTISAREGDADRLAATLFGKTRRRLLGWLFTHPDGAFYVRELVRVTGAAQGAVSRDLEKLSVAGILRRTVRGREVFYQAESTCPIFGELQSIFLKTAGLTDQIRGALKPLGSRVLVAFIHGSAATGGLRAASDVDLVVIGRVSFGEVVSALGRAQSRLGREINPVVYTPAEFRTKVRSRHHFVTAILREPHLFVVGGPRELERLGAERLVGASSTDATGDRRSVRRRGARPRG